MCLRLDCSPSSVLNLHLEGKIVCDVSNTVYLILISLLDLQLLKESVLSPLVILLLKNVTNSR